MPAALNSDHVNYLIWRYLQEQGYGKSAVQLSREWDNKDPQSLPFADHVKHHTLIHMLQDALTHDKLIFDAQKRVDEAAESGDENLETFAKKQYLCSRWGFVDIKKRKHIDGDGVSLRRVSIIEEDAENRRKRSRRNTLEGQRVRRSKALRPPEKQTEQPGRDVEPEVVATPQILDDAERDGEEAAPEEPLPLPTLTLDTGRSIGLQSEYADEESALHTVATHVLRNADIYRVNWDDDKDNQLTITGGSACHSVIIEPQSAEHQQATSQNSGTSPDCPFTVRTEEILEKPAGLVKYSVSQWEKHPFHPRIAAAVEELQMDRNATNSIRVFGHDTTGMMRDVPSVVFALKWCPSSNSILSCWDAGDDTSSYLTIWSLDGNTPTIDIQSPGLIRDVLWLDDDRFACCGEKLYSIYKIDNGVAILETAVETEASWDYMKYEHRSKIAVCVPETDCVLGLADTMEKTFQTKQTHDDAISSVQWEPWPNPDQSSEQDAMQRPRILATSCVGGCLKLWKSGPVLECLHTFTFGPIMPVWSIAFSLNGLRLAAVTGHQVHVWQLEGDVRPHYGWADREKINKLGTWEEPQNLGISDGAAGQQPNEIHQEETEADEDELDLFSLAWDRSGTRLALAHGSLISIIAVPTTEGYGDTAMTDL